MRKLFDYKSPNPGQMSDNLRQYLTKKQLIDLVKEKAAHLNSAEQALKSLAGQLGKTSDQIDQMDDQADQMENRCKEIRRELARLKKVNEEQEQLEPDVVVQERIQEIIKLEENTMTKSLYIEKLRSKVQKQIDLQPATQEQPV